MDPSQRLVPVDVPHSTETLAGTVAHDPILVPCLVQEHRDMLALLESIRSRTRQGCHAELATQLSRLQASLEAHLLSERLRLYGYLEDSLASEPRQLARMREAQAEAGRLALRVKEFAERVRHSPASLATAVDVLGELQDLGDAMRARFEAQERDLYPLYPTPQRNYG